MTISQTLNAQADPSPAIRQLAERIEKESPPGVWICRCPADHLEAQLKRIIERKRQGLPQPLFGVPFAIKDNIDLAGIPTTAACPAFSYTPQRSATVVQRLCDAGAIAMGKTNLDQFATGLVGTRSPYGICRNSFNPEYISGGSSSGSAVAVAKGWVSFSLGTDTAGSGRVPATFNNLVGLKPTRGLVSCRGVVPACQSLDCVSVFAHNCRDARTVLDIIEGFDADDPYSRRRDEIILSSTSQKRFGVPRRDQLQFFGDQEAESLYRNSIESLKSLGFASVEIDFDPFIQTANMLYSGPWVAERYLVIRELLEKNPEAVLSITRQIISRGREISAADTFAAMHKLGLLRHAANREMAKIDFLLLPTAGTIYTVDQVQADPIQLNTNLGYYTNFVNLLDLCALAVPAGFKKVGVPLGVTLIAPAGCEELLLNAGDALHQTKRN